MDFLHRADVKERYGIERDMSHKTACRYLHELGYRYQATPKGHRLPDTNIHSEIHEISRSHGIMGQRWNKASGPACTWSQKSHCKGASLMIAHFVSADFGWLTSPDGTKSAIHIFKPGKNRDGYFSNEDIISQTDIAIDILLEYYPQFDHRPDDSLSARNMPKGIPKPGKNWGIEILMRDGRLPNGEPQPLYFPVDHPNENLRGVFKGMAKPIAAAVASSTTSPTLPMSNHCLKRTAVLGVLMLFFCQNFTNVPAILTRRRS
ncbi:hypothetical protein BJ912DRAFT_975118 [Pholiota molesta]|nr:hypothetical protein BJ912DRAFT_975118 [Pholiota molesta]